MDSDQRKALRPWRRRMAAEAALSSALWAGAFVLPLWMALAVVCRGTGAHWTRYMPGAWALLAALLYLFRYRPTPRRVAGRIDQWVGGDRACTMVEFQKDDSLLCRLQREDALVRIGKADPSRLPIRFSALALAICLVSAAGVAAVHALPDQAFAWLPFQPAVESEESRMLRGKVEQLRQEVEAAPLTQEEKDQLLEMLSLMEAQIGEGTMDISMLTEISRRMEAWTTAEDQQKPLASYTLALLEQESLRPLGEAILAQDMDAVGEALSAMGERLTALEGNQQVNALMGIVYDISATLKRPLQDEGQAKLTHTMVVLSGDLEGAAAMKYGHQGPNSAIEQALDKAELGIASFLSGDQAYQESEDSEKDPSLPQAPSKFSASGQGEGVRLPSQTEYVYDPPQTAAEDYVPGAPDAQGNPQRILAPQDESLDGTVPYGQVLSRYYAQYLDEQSALPQDLWAVIGAYFDGM